MTVGSRICAWAAIPAAVCVACLSMPVATSAQSSDAQARHLSTAPDPRENLRPGLYDAGQAALNIQLVATVPKPPGFLAFVEPPPGPRPYTMRSAGGAPGTDPAELAFGNGDMAFQGTRLILGNMNGFLVYDIANPRKVALLAAVVCPGGQGDVSVYGHLLFMSVEEPRARIDCGTEAIPTPPDTSAPTATAPTGQRNRGPGPASPLRFRGVRIFDIADVAHPTQIAAVQTCRGSHTNTLVTSPTDSANVYDYVSGTAYVRAPGELAGCNARDPADSTTSLFSIDIIQVPLAAPATARIVASPRVFADTSTGAINGLWKGGTHGDSTQSTAETNQCHDITAYPAIGLAAGACAGNGLLLNIADPVHPVRIDEVIDPNFAYWHSATFNNDGTTVIFSDEWGGGVQPRCRATDPKMWGADAIFTLVNHRLTFASYYKMPAAQPATKNCVAHNGSLIPVPGRDIAVQAWYQGGLSVMDFTDAAHPVEIAYFDRGPLDSARLIVAGYFSVYWYNGYVYGSEIARGLDVFRLRPSEFLTQNEIDAAQLLQLGELNVQDQPKFTWTPSFVVARAYLDQLRRDQGLPSEEVARITNDLAEAERLRGATQRSALDKLANRVATDVSRATDQRRVRLLAADLQALSAGKR